MMPHLASLVQDPPIAQDLSEMQSTLLAKDVQEVIEHATKNAADRDPFTENFDPFGYEDDEDDVAPSPDGNTLLVRAPTKHEISKRRRIRCMRIIDVVVYFTVMASVLKYGLAMDIQPEAQYWIVMECCFVVVFVAEMLLKNAILGCREYFCGFDRYWNWMDTIITIIAVGDSVMEFVRSEVGQDLFPSLDPEEVEDVYAWFPGKLMIVIRGLRVIRIARLVKMLRAPFLRDLAAMLNGLLIGTPTLIWLMVLLSTVVYVLALGFRAVVGPDPGDMALRPKCGNGDAINDQYKTVAGYGDNDECPIHRLIGEEFFPTVPRSMFTVFRCLIGDCSTSGGQSLAVHLGSGYGWMFYIVYFTGMTVAIFGLFNVITALFVEATLSGLKKTDDERKKAVVYEGKFVRRRLYKLVDRIKELLWQGREDLRRLSKKEKKDSDGSETCAFDMGEEEVMDQGISLTDKEYMRVIRDRQVNKLLDDIDVDAMDREGLFDIADSNKNGRVSLPELLDVFIRMRGELKKSDVLSGWVALHALQEKFATFELVLLTNQQTMLDRQATIIDNTSSSRRGEGGPNLAMARMLPSWTTDPGSDADVEGTT
jgi:hypothetical protein